jgi:hypothetical protein
MSTQDQNQLTDHITSLFVDRANVWIEMCVAIANYLPGTWGCIETHIDARYNLTEVRLIDLAYDGYSGVLNYSVSAETPGGGTRSFFTLDIPLRLAAEAGDDDAYLPLLDYLETTPNVVDKLFADDTPLELFSRAVDEALNQFPDMVADKATILDLNNRLAEGSVFLSPPSDQLQ